MHNRVIHFIKTKSVKSDGRLLKEINTLDKLGIKSEVIALQDDNIEHPKIAYKNFILHTIKLKTRKFFPKSKGYILKVPEYSIKTLMIGAKLKSTCWIFHENQNYLSIAFVFLKKLFKQKTKVIWDQHELPHPVFFRYKLTKNIFTFLLSNVDAIIFTNNERKKIVCENFKLDDSNLYILNNYPEQKYITSEKKTLPEEIKRWCNGIPYILWQGIANNSRNFESALLAYSKFKNQFKLVILGSLTEDSIRKLEQLIGPNYKDFVYQKFVPQDMIINYVDNAQFSIVLYRNISNNNIFCEPNRLYQAITRGVPVICGNNPPMKKIIQETDCGIVLEDDGSNPLLLESSIKKLLNNYNSYVNNCMDNRFKFCWEEQAYKVFSDITTRK